MATIEVCVFCAVTSVAALFYFTRRHKNEKKLSLLLVFALVFVLVACNNENTTTSTPSTTTTRTESTGQAETTSPSASTSNTSRASETTTSNILADTTASSPTTTGTVHTAGSKSTTTNKSTTRTNPNTPTTTKRSESTTTSHIHKFSEATCTEPKTCVCGAVDGNALGHNHINGKCSRCGAPDPDYKEYDTYLNGVGYNLGTELTIDIILTTNDTDISICPAFTYYKKVEDTFIPHPYDNSIEDTWGEEPTLPMSHGGPIWREDAPDVLLIYGNWRWMGSGLLNDKIYDFSQGNVIIRLKYVVTEKGEFEFRIRDGEDYWQNYDEYTDALSVHIYESTDSDGT